ncbi:MAG: DUF1232 domain-containing protein, partial [Thermoguttaceae bacterium]|nr:DUF1232 domain-containing protein [Thermoguttaceae bacterium]
MVGASLAGEYSGLSKTTLVCFLGALMYCVSPLDAIPDALPMIGLLDDIFVVGWTAQR